ncbi:hypothetical protein HSIEG1_3050 [Enterococcus sp. HSIEG1]|nr:hypothetical protein HSIEG1_3050 [Enterococcus sp. HSIEG1]
METNLISYLSSYVFWLLTSFPEINQTLVSKKILVISDMGINHSQYISYYVQDILDLHKIRSDILPINGEQLGNYDLESFDLIITNQPISETNVPSVVINDALLFSNKKNYWTYCISKIFLISESKKIISCFLLVVSMNDYHKNTLFL